MREKITKSKEGFLCFGMGCETSGGTWQDLHTALALCMLCLSTYLGIFPAFCTGTGLEVGTLQQAPVLPELVVALPGANFM